MVLLKSVPLVNGVEFVVVIIITLDSMKQELSVDNLATQIEVWTDIINVHTDGNGLSFMPLSIQEQGTVISTHTLVYQFF